MEIRVHTQQCGIGGRKLSAKWKVFFEVAQTGATDATSIARDQRDPDFVSAAALVCPSRHALASRPSNSANIQYKSGHLCLGPQALPSTPRALRQTISVILLT